MHQRLESLAAMDAAHVVHPYGNLRANQSGTPMVITRGDGIYVYDDAGNKYLEGVAALWYAALGFSEDRLAEAAYKQMKRLPCYHAFGNKVADVAVKLADKLAEVAPPGLDHVFFAGSGSEANDTAMKIIRYYNNALGRPQKKKFISRHWAYHGTTIATASLTGVPRNHWDFDLPIDGVIHTECPNYYRNGLPGELPESFSDRMVARLEEIILREGPETVAAFFAEPVMGVGGVIVPPSTYFEKVQAVLRKHDVLFVVDEVISGFGRLGDMFGTQTFDLKPDIMVLAKGISSGYQAISAVLMNDKVFDAIAANSAKHGVFGHGFTFSAHPVAAAVALESIKIYEEIDIIAKVRSVAPRLWEGLEQFRSSRIVGDVRGIGLMAGIEFVADKATKRKFTPEVGVARIAEANCLKHGLILRAIGDVLAISPPLIITRDEIDLLIARIGLAIDDTEVELLSQGLLR